MKHAANGHKVVSVVICNGNLNADSMIRFKTSLARLLHQKRKHLILDLAKARRADFSGVGILMDRLQKIRAERGDLKIINMRPSVSKTFQRIGADQVIETFASKTDAVRSLGLAL